MVHCFRLTRGTDLKEALLLYASEHRLRAAAVVSAVGCVLRWNYRDASGCAVKQGDSHAEILSVHGTLYDAGCHLHIALAGEDGAAFGGHLMEGCIVNTTAEIVLLEFDGYAFSRAYDETTGYDELFVSKT